MKNIFTWIVWIFSQEFRVMIGAKPNLVIQQRMAAKTSAMKTMNSSTPTMPMTNGTGSFVTTSAIIPPGTPVSNSVTRK